MKQHLAVFSFQTGAGLGEGLRDCKFSPGPAWGLLQAAPCMQVHPTLMFEAASVRKIQLMAQPIQGHAINMCCR